MIQMLQVRPVIAEAVKPVRQLFRRISESRLTRTTTKSLRGENGSPVSQSANAARWERQVNWVGAKNPVLAFGTVIKVMLHGQPDGPLQSTALIQIDGRWAGSIRPEDRLASIRNATILAVAYGESVGINPAGWGKLVAGLAQAGYVDAAWGAVKEVLGSNAPKYIAAGETVTSAGKTLNAEAVRQAKALPRSPESGAKQSRPLEAALT